MRIPPAVVLSLALVAAAPAAAAPLHRSSWRPQPWRPPVASIAGSGAVRSDPLEPGSPLAPELASAMAAHRAALAAVPVVRRPDGSRAAVLGGLARRWTVARVADDGALHESCVTTEAAARALVAAPGSERAK